MTKTCSLEDMREVIAEVRYYTLNIWGEPTRETNRHRLGSYKEGPYVCQNCHEQFELWGQVRMHLKGIKV